MRILITGATGFVGTHLRHYLLNHTDWDIVGTCYPDAPPPPLDPKREHLLPLDLRDKNATNTTLADYPPDYVIHLAAQSHVPTAYKDPWGTLDNNIRGQLNLLEGCITLNLKPHILIIGSGEEYGRADAAELPLVETHPLRPENPYSVSKVAQDVMGYQYFISYDLPVTRARPFNHVGPGQSPRFVLAAFASQVARIETGQQDPVMRVGNLEPARDFTDVRDVVKAYRSMMLDGEPGEVYNVCSGEAIAVRDLAEALIELSTIEQELVTDPELMRPVDIPVLLGDSERLRRATGWKPEVPLPKTLSDLLDDMRSRVAD